MDGSDTYLHSAYQVSIIPTDLHHEETIIRAAQSLDCLNKTINSIFGRIDARLERNGAKVQHINERVMRAQAKINALVGSKKSINIFAPARFPGSSILTNIPATFPQVAQKPMDPSTPNKNNNSSQCLRNCNEDANNKQDADAELNAITFHVRGEDRHENQLATQRQQTNRTAGLGPMPVTKSMPSITRFNTDEFVYAGGTGGMQDLNAWKRTLPPQNSKTRVANRPKPAKSEFLAPAPHSLAHGTTKLTTPAGDLRYTPAALAAPAIDVPLDLPDLPGIANDLQYEPVEEQTPIAPSHQFVDLPDLPGLEEPEKEINKTLNITVEALAAQTHMTKRTVPLYAQCRSEPLSLAPPPPPPPPPPPIPPPPPPPPSTEAVVSVKADYKLLSNEVMKPISPSMDTPLNIPESRPPPPPDPRSELMAAIRKAGGAHGGRLRSPAAAPVNLDVVDTERNNTIRSRAGGPDSGGNLMADLHNKLMLRRKGISGNQHLADQCGNPLMRHLSSVIEAPTKQNTAKSSDDENSDEDDGWEE